MANTIIQAAVAIVDARQRRKNDEKDRRIRELEEEVRRLKARRK